MTEETSVLVEILVELVQRLVERPIGVSPLDTNAECACNAALPQGGVVVVDDDARPPAALELQPCQMDQPASK